MNVSYSYNDCTNTVSIYIDNMIAAEISEVYSEKEAADMVDEYIYENQIGMAD